MNALNNITTKSKKLAFTLAEILIVLGIIGIVAEMTIPTLIADFQDKALKVRWKKEYSTISQIFSTIANDNGGSVNGVFSSTADAITNVFPKYAKIIRSCTAYTDITTNSGGCWSNPVYSSKGVVATTTTPGYGMVLVDGTFVTMILRSNCYSTAYAMYSPNESTGNGGAAVSDSWNCGSMLVDVNGLKPPNTWGADIFGILVYPNYLKPYSSSIYPTTSTSSFGDLLNSSTYLYQ